jgi:hypothetical protein
MRVKKSEYIKDYKIKLLFSDGVTKIVDFEPILNSERKLLAPLLDLKYFKKFYVDEITICWPNELDFAPEVLYKIGIEVKPEARKISHKRRVKTSSETTISKGRVAAKPPN